MSYLSSDALSYYRSKFNELKILERRRSLFVGGYVLGTWIIIMAVLMSDEFMPALYGGCIVYGLLTYIFYKAYVEVNKDINKVNSIINVPNPFI